MTTSEKLKLFDLETEIKQTADEADDIYECLLAIQFLKRRGVITHAERGVLIENLRKKHSIHWHTMEKASTVFISKPFTKEEGEGFIRENYLRILQERSPKLS